MEEFPEGEGVPVPYSGERLAREMLLSAPREFPTFSRSELTPELVGLVTPLLIAHWREVSLFKDIPLDPDWEGYFRMQQAGVLRLFLAHQEGQVVGYNAFFLTPHLHYRGSPNATNDVIFINPAARGFGRKFIAWCSDELARDGAQLVTYHVKTAHDWSKVLVEQDFVLVESVWAKRLDVARRVA